MVIPDPEIEYRLQCIFNLLEMETMDTTKIYTVNIIVGYITLKYSQFFYLISTLKFRFVEHSLRKKARSQEAVVITSSPFKCNYNFNHYYKDKTLV